MRSRNTKRMLVALLVVLLATTVAEGAEVRAHLRFTPTAKATHLKKLPPAVLWLKPLSFAPTLPPAGHPTIVQRKKTFTPHLVIVPVGANVTFPNDDPFFHNVFSLFDGKRFDLGLYEAGSSRSVTFSREGVSYIFCNIHPEMSAVVIALATQYYSTADAAGEFHLARVPDGDYELHLWVEGERPETLDRYTRRVHITGDGSNLGDFNLEVHEPTQHLNKFGQPYDTTAPAIY